jgi:hypothetical protein
MWQQLWPCILQVPMIRAALLHRMDWQDLAERAKREQFGPASRQLSQQRIQSMLKAIDLMGGMEEEESSQQVGVATPRMWRAAVQHLPGMQVVPDLRGIQG